MVPVQDPVKGRRYDSTARQAASQATRQRIVDEARSLFLEHGYRRTTVAAIAAAAGVHADTVYALIGRKPVLLRELFEQALSGTDRAVAAEERAAILAVREAGDPDEKLRRYATSVRQVMERMAPLFLAVRDASGTDAESAAVWQSISDRRAANMRRLVADVRVAAGERARTAVDLDEAADSVWALNSPELFVMLTAERGWPADRYERWLADSLRRLLLGP